MNSLQKVVFTNDDGILTVSLKDSGLIELVAGQSDFIEKKIIPLTNDAGKAFALNFNEVLMIDSTGIGLLMKMIKACEAKGTKIQSINVPADLRELFESMHLSDRLGVSG